MNGFKRYFLLIFFILLNNKEGIMQWNRRIAKADACCFIQIQIFVCLQNH